MFFQKGSLCMRANGASADHSAGIKLLFRTKPLQSLYFKKPLTCSVRRCTTDPVALPI